MTEHGDFDPHYDPRYELGYRDGAAGCVRPAAIDRDALLPAIAKAIDDNYDEEDYRPVYTEAGEIVDSAAARAVLALVRPVAEAPSAIYRRGYEDARREEPGVTLTPEEKALLAKAARKWATAEDNAAWAASLTDDQKATVFSDEPKHLRALAARLEAEDD